jgi:acetylornithine deacetylase/succinyl-diaminopimelate desuccinylase-like protein
MRRFAPTRRGDEYFVDQYGQIPAPMTTLEILDRLIAFPTVSRDSNRDLIEFVRSFLAQRNIEAELICTADGRKANLFATVGPKDVPGVMLSGHTDVVPIDGQNWSADPFRLRLSNGRAHGRGTADMKGFLACVLSLVGRMAGTTLSKPIHLAFSHDEEVGCVGVRSLIDTLGKRPVKPDFAIVGDPTQMRHRAQGQDRCTGDLLRRRRPFRARAGSSQGHPSRLRLRGIHPQEPGRNRGYRPARRGL